MFRLIAIRLSVWIYQNYVILGGPLKLTKFFPKNFSIIKFVTNQQVFATKNSFGVGSGLGVGRVVQPFYVMSGLRPTHVKSYF